MQDARYFRNQAELCLKLANQMSDLRSADHLRMEAAQHFAKAAELGPAAQPQANERWAGMPASQARNNK